MKKSLHYFIGVLICSGVFIRYLPAAEAEPDSDDSADSIVQTADVATTLQAAALCSAIADGKAEEVTRLLQDPSINPNIPNVKGFKPLQLAIAELLLVDTEDTRRILMLLLHHRGDGITHPLNAEDINNALLNLVEACIKTPGFIRPLQVALCGSLVKAGANPAASLRILDAALADATLHPDKTVPLTALRSKMLRISRNVTFSTSTIPHQDAPQVGDDEV